ncbi:MAG TPA: DegT/DnrJ/EryC1/StrS family aminotransferase [Myxococcota bacterium]
MSAGFARVLERTSFILGAEVAEFETGFARFVGVPHCIGVANGTDALELALRALGIGAGDEVVVPTNSFIASALAVARTGARPVLVDCDHATLLIDVADVERKLTPHTRALMPVHLFGQVAPMERLAPLAEARGIAIVEDAAQAQGAARHGRSAGSFGSVAATSFYPGKNLGAYGDAGAVLTASDELAERLRALRNYGSEVKYHHPETGFNSRLDTLQAVVLNAKLKRLAGWNAARGQAARRYDELLAGTPGLTLPVTLPGNQHIWHLYTVRVPRRDEVLAQLAAAGIGAGVHYPVPIHLQGAFRHLGHGKGDFPVAERAAGELLSLPIYAEITPAQQERTAAVLKRALA